jgi:cell wall-associated NlpC family hydrolase
MRCCAPGVVLGKLVSAGAADALEARQLVAAPALLAEALRLAAVLKAGQLQVHLADAAALVVRAQRAQLAPAALHLRAHAQPLGNTPRGTLSSVGTAAAQAVNNNEGDPPAPPFLDAIPQHRCTFHLLSMVGTYVPRYWVTHRVRQRLSTKCPRSPGSARAWSAPRAARAAAAATRRSRCSRPPPRTARPPPRHPLPRRPAPTRAAAPSGPGPAACAAR